MSRPFRADIEGLRAVAVLAVLGFHAGVPLFAGGYVGVDVFFVISGFLITGMLLARSRISLTEFYAARSRRILPAAAFVLVVTAVASSLILPPLRQRDVAWDVIASALNVANWRFVAVQTDYLAAGQAQSPLLHYWSLAVEEQFYLIWAPLLLVVSRVSRRLIGAVIALVTAGSFALGVYWTQLSEPLAYLASPSRAWQFGLGGLLALVTGVVPRRLAGPLGIGGIAAVVFATAVFTTDTPFPGWAALVPTLGTVAVIYAGPAGVVGRALTDIRVRAIGRLSYTWYLWHWPVLVLAESRLGELAWPAKSALVLASAGLAWLTMRLIERPLRFSVALRRTPREGLSMAVTAAVVPVMIALVLGTAAVRPTTPALASGALVGAVDGPNLTVRPGAGIFPAPAQARRDHPRVGDCLLVPLATTSPPCRFGTRDAADRIVLYGDSHAAQWMPLVERIATDRGWAIEVLAKAGCPPARLKLIDPQLGREYRECDVWREHALGRITTGRAPKLIVVGMLNRYSPDRERMRAALADPIARLTGTGAPVVYIRDIPFPERDVPACVSGALDTPRKCAFPRSRAILPDVLADAGWPGVSVVNVNDVLCPGVGCPAVLDGVLLYRDDAHLTNTAATLLAARMERTLVNFGVLR